LTLREVDPDAWDGVLERLGRADAYLRRGYVEASCVLDGGRPALLHAAAEGGDVVFACSVRPIPGSDLHDVTSAYGYGGPVGAGSAPPIEAFWEHYESWCNEHGVVSTFVRFHPLFANHRHPGSSVRLERLADTVAWPLRADEDPVRSLHRHHRRVVRKAADALEVSVRERPERLDSFAALYEAGMRRLDAARFYFFPETYWETLAARLGPALLQLDGVLDGEPVASVLCLTSPPWLHYHLGAALEPGRKVGATHLLLFEAARWGSERGYEVLHLGGGVGGARDSLWEFKRRFAPKGLREAWIGKAVHDEAAYLALSGAESLDVSGFFPAYRAPHQS
jgi:GNAT acetyltransferase-like protein